MMYHNRLCLILLSAVFSHLIFQSSIVHTMEQAISQDKPAEIGKEPKSKIDSCLLPAKLLQIAEEQCAGLYWDVNFEQVGILLARINKYYKEPQSAQSKNILAEENSKLGEQGSNNEKLFAGTPVMSEEIRLGKDYYFGRNGQEKDSALAEECFLDVLEQADEARACIEAWRLLGTLFPQDIVELSNSDKSTYSELACVAISDFSKIKSLRARAFLYLGDPRINKHKRSRRLYLSLAAEQERDVVVQAKAAKEIARELGFGIVYDGTLRLVERAASQTNYPKGCIKACYELGCIYRELGGLCTDDLEYLTKAKHYFERAASQNHHKRYEREARKALEEVHAKLELLKAKLAPTDQTRELSGLAEENFATAERLACSSDKNDRDNANKFYKLAADQLANEVIRTKASYCYAQVISDRSEKRKYLDRASHGADEEISTQAMHATALLLLQDVECQSPDVTMGG